MTSSKHIETKNESYSIVSLDTAIITLKLLGVDVFSPSGLYIDGYSLRVWSYIAEKEWIIERRDFTDFIIFNKEDSSDKYVISEAVFLSIFQKVDD